MQRPGVLETVSIDLYIIRVFGMFLRRFPQIKTDIVDLLDEWAARFFEELDYVKEGNNGTKFAEQMQADLPQVRQWPEFAKQRSGGLTPLCNHRLAKPMLRCTPLTARCLSGQSVVMCRLQRRSVQIKVAKTYETFTARRVLTVEWLEGEKLSQSNENDVGALVNLGVICYLKQLLQTGFFHAGAPLVCVRVMSLAFDL